MPGGIFEDEFIIEVAPVIIHKKKDIEQNRLGT